MDILLAIVPRIQDDFGYTPAGTALLKGSLEKHGFSSQIFDFNVDLESSYQGKDLVGISNFFMVHDAYNERICNLSMSLIDKWAQQIVAVNPKWLGISVFSYNSHRATRLLSIRVKQLQPNIKIVMGGAGIQTDFTFAETLHSQKIIDFYIRGEGEIALIELLQSNTTYPGINGIPSIQINDIDQIPYPNYDDYELATYTNRRGLIALPITGSRGCVRSCTFCDIASQWPKYRFRSGSNIAGEIKHQVAKYGVNAFRFTDSLINGSLKAFRDMIDELAEYRDTLAVDKKFLWDSHFIVRGPKEMPPACFDVMARAGANLFLIGVESGSQRVRDHMKKGFTQEQLDYCMEQFARVGIKVRFLMIIGYPTETQEDFQDTIDMFTRYQHYTQLGTIDEVNLGLTLNLLNNTPLHNDREKYNVIQEGNHINNWICTDNPTLDFKERLRRRIFLQEHVESIGYKTFESKNYTRQLVSAWSEVSRLPPPIILDGQVVYDRDRGGLLQQPAATDTHKIMLVQK
jgi:radical SAM superfamily enzyme YgiQ (UPF0313 family)